jgi:hypothetical protein
VRTRPIWLLVGALFLAACGETSATMEGEVDRSNIAEAAAAADLPAALEAGERIVEDLLASLDVDPRDRDDVRPYRVSLCDEVADEDGPSLVSVARGIAFPAERTDDVIEQVRVALEDAGVEGVRVVRRDSVLPLVTGVFADDTWQVGATLNREDGIGEVRVSSACLPGELPDPPASG